MAIIQISKVLVRTGDEQDLPQLDTGELGYSTDVKKLYIGDDPNNNPENLIINNTEVLTEHSNIAFNQIDLTSGANFTTENIHISGGQNGYVLQTDGQGNLSWTTKNTLLYFIDDVTQTSPAIVTFTSNQVLTNGQLVTISDIYGVANIPPSSLTGTITANTLSSTVTGNGTSFTTETAIGQTIVSASNTSSVIGTVFSIANNTSLTLRANSFANVTNEIVKSGLNELNGNTAFVKVLNDTQVELYVDSALTVPVDTSSFSSYYTGGRVIALLSSGSGTSVGGTNTQVQFNNNGVFAGSSNLTFDSSTVTLTVNGVSNVVGNLNVTLNSNLGNLATANYFTGVLTTNAQPNITSLGTLTSLNVTGNSNVGNLGTQSIVATGNATVTGNVQANNFVTSNLTIVGSLGTISATGNGTFGNINTGIVSATGNGTFANISTGIVSASGNGTFNNISTGIVSATGNGTFANITTGRLTATSNANLGNLTTGLISASSNITGSNLITSGQIISTVASGTAPLVVTSATMVANLYSATAGTAGTVTTNAQPNITSTGILTSLSVSGNITANNYTSGNVTIVGSLGTISASGNANVGNIGAINGVFTNISGNGSALTNITGANVTGTVANANYASFAGSAPSAGTATTAITVTGNSQGNITSVGILTSLSVSGNVDANNFMSSNVAIVGSLGTVSATGNITANNFRTSNVTIVGSLGTISASGNANVGNIGAINGVFTNVSGNGSGLSSITGANVTGTVANATYATSAGSATTATSATTAGTVTGNAQGNITSVGILTSLSVSGTVTAGNLSVSGGTVGGGNTTLYGNVLTTGGNTTPGTIIGDWTLSLGSRLNATYADLAEYYQADSDYEPGTVLMFGGINEVTIADIGTNKVAGIVSTNPAYVMNSGCTGNAVAIALQGRVPTKVKGNVSKGDMMVSGGNGYAMASSQPTLGTVIGKSLENFTGTEGTIEIAVGRL